MKKLSRTLFLIVFLCALFLNLNCKKDNPTQPPPPITMDTTSHSFTWTTFSFGDGNSSTLYDVAIINDTLAYAVGEIYLKDSLGTLDLLPHNLAVWNGQNWKFQKLLYQGLPPVIRSVCALSESNMWLDPWFYWNGQSFLEISVDPIFNGIRINKMWSNSKEVYAVGDNGFIAVYNGTKWSKIESGTSISLLDVWGGQKENGEIEVIAIGSNGNFLPQGLALIQIQSNQAVPLGTTGLSLDMFGIWFVPGTTYYSVGDAVYQTGTAGGNWTKQSNLSLSESYCVRGTKANDVFVAGWQGLLMHYNGSTWHVYTEHETAKFEGVFGSIAVKGNLCIAAGYLNSGKAVCAIGRRQL